MFPWNVGWFYGKRTDLMLERSWVRFPGVFKPYRLKIVFAVSVLSKQHPGERRETWLAQSQNNESATSSKGLFLSWASTLKIRLGMSVEYKANIIQRHSSVIWSEYPYNISLWRWSPWNQSIIYLMFFRLKSYIYYMHMNMHKIFPSNVKHHKIDRLFTLFQNSYVLLNICNGYKNVVKVLKSLWYMYHYCKRLSVRCRKRSFKSETVVQTLVNRTSCDI